MLTIWCAEVHLGPAQSSYLPSQGKANVSARRGAEIRKRRAVRAADLPVSLTSSPSHSGQEQSGAAQEVEGEDEHHAPVPSADCGSWGLQEDMATPVPLTCGRSHSCRASQQGHRTGTHGLLGQSGHSHPQGSCRFHTVLLLLFLAGENGLLRPMDICERGRCGHGGAVS